MSTRMMISILALVISVAFWYAGFPTPAAGFFLVGLCGFLIEVSNR